MNMACLIDQGDIAITQGNNYPPPMWQFLSSENPDVLLPLAGNSFYLTVYWGSTQIEASSEDGSLNVDLINSIVTWNLTVAQSRSLPLGRVARYELERWFSNYQQSVIKASFAVETGFNPDVGPIPLQPETSALVAAMTVQPSTARQTLINQTIFDLKAANIWTRLDFLFVLAAHDAQAGRLNWISPAQVASANNSPTFTVDRGYSGDGISAYLGTGINLSALVKFTQNNCSLGVYVTNDAQSPSGTNLAIVGLFTTAGRISLAPRSDTNLFGSRLLSGNTTGPSTSSRGHLMTSRASASGYDRYKNGVLIDSVAATSLTILTEEIVFLRNSAVGQTSINHVLGAAHAGSSLTGSQVASLNTILAAYMAGVGLPP